jgi:hypothetical protein
MAQQAPPRQMRRTAPRIVPAIPLALSRPPPAARPLTPDESAIETVTQQDTEPSPPTAENEARGLPAKDPLTPLSTASGVKHDDVEVGAPTSAVDVPEEPLETQGTDTFMAKLSSPTTADCISVESAPAQANTFHEYVSLSPAPETPAVNGNHVVSRSELPSPFYPTEKSYTQYSTAESSQEHVQGTALHQTTRSSSDDTGLGVTQGVSSVPHDFEPAAAAFVPPPFAMPFFPGHSHHPSDAQAPWTLPTLAVAPVATYPPPDLAAHMTYPGVHHNMNGRSRPHSQSPTNPHFNGTKTNSEYGDERFASPHMNGSAKPQTLHAPHVNEPLELAAYMSSQFGNPDFADFILQVRSEESILLQLPVHGIVVQRSRVIASAIRTAMLSASRTRGSPQVIDIPCHDQFATPESLNEAIKVLYGAPLLSADNFLYSLAPFYPTADQPHTSADARQRMAQAISYAAAGKFFQIHSMHERGLAIVKAVLRWDTFEQALYFALDKSPHSSGKLNGTSGPEQVISSRFLDHDLINFLAYNFPVPFKLYTIAPELALNPRLPTFPKTAAHNPRLSRIRFGDVPPEDELAPDHATRTISSVLLSLPLPLIERLLNHPSVLSQRGWGGAEKIMRDVVGERESRRLKALNNQPAAEDVRRGMYSNFLMENLLWVESMKPSPEHSLGFTLSERRLER